MKYITMIDSFYPSLSKSEKKVADYIKDKKNAVIYQTLSGISNDISVGEATVLRFCQKIGFAGFQDLKLRIAQESKTYEKVITKGYIEAVTANIHKTIDSTKSILDLENLKEVIELILTSQRVLIYGIGASGYAALEMQSRLLRFGKIVQVVTDSHFQLMTSSVLAENDLIIAFSLTGYTLELIDSLKLAKLNKVNIVSITNHITSPIANISDRLLLTAGKESPIDGGSLTGKISQLYIVDLICTGYALENEELSNRMIGKTAKSIIGKTLEYKD